jgi:plasmid maintenance system antidote protein VapI
MKKQEYKITVSAIGNHHQFWGNLKQEYKITVSAIGNHHQFWGNLQDCINYKWRVFANYNPNTVFKVKWLKRPQ